MRCNLHFTRTYSVAASAKGVQAMAAAGTMVRQHLTVETDPERLVNFVCGLSVDRDTPDPALRPDSEYPDWLWTLRTERGAKRLDELEPDTYAYWRHIRRASMKRDAALRKTQIRFKDFRKIKPVD